MLTIIAWVGRLSMPLLGSLVPGLSPGLIMWAVGALAVLVVTGAPAGAVWIHMHGVKREAVSKADARCELRIAEGARISAESLTHVLGVIKAGEESADEPKTKAAEIELCRKSKQCLEAK